MAERDHAPNGGPYRIEQRVEGLDDVFEATRGGKEYLLALYAMGGGGADELAGEVERTRALTHPGIVSVVEAFDHDGGKALVFERVQGVTLHALWRDIDRMSDGAALHIAHSLFSALNAAHTARDASGNVVPLVHGRLGPHQLFLSWAGDVKLLGFGLSLLHRMAAAAPGAIDLDGPYVAPEVRGGGALTVRANVFFGGADGVAIADGRRPIKGSTARQATARPQPHGRHDAGPSTESEALGTSRHRSPADADARTAGQLQRWRWP